MARLVRLLAVTAVFFPAAGGARADDSPALLKALALEEALQDAIQAAEPSVACISVSRSEAYRKWFKDPSPADNPGRLGGFPGRAAIPADNPQARAELDEIMRRFHSNDIFEAFSVLKKRYDLGDPDNVPESFGSGVVLDDTGLVLTNYHVIRGATKLYVRLPGGKGSWADIHAADPRSDLAVIRLLEPKGLTLRAIKLGDGGKVRKGTLVLGLANPFAAGSRDGSPSASWGIVSNIRRRSLGKPAHDEVTLQNYGTLLQTDVRLSLGCSGGALVNLKGELIGLTTSLAAISGSETAGGFAIPLDDPARRIIDILKKGEEVEYGFLGVSFSKIEHGEGVRFERIIPGSPAERAGLQSGEFVLAVNGTRVNSTDDLRRLISTALAGREVTLRVAPSTVGPTREVTATLAKFNVSGKVIATTRHPFAHGLRVDYTSMLISPDRTGPPVLSLPAGVYVREVQPGSQAETAKLEHAIVTEVNGRPVNSPAEFYREAGKPGPVELTLGTRDDNNNPRKLKLD